jgi:hypothetical protein
MLDCFTGSELHPLKFSDKAFYLEGKTHLMTSGVLCTNIHETDTEFSKKYSEFTESFNHVLETRGMGSCVLFGWDDDSISFEKIKKKVFEIESEKNGC